MKPALLSILFVWLLGFDVFAQEPKLMLPIGHTDPVTYAEFSPDERKFVTSSRDGTAKIWDAETYMLLADLKGHKGPVVSVHFSLDGKKIITASNDDIVKIWDTNSGLQIADFKVQAHGLKSANFSPDGQMVVIASDSDNTTKILDVLRGTVLANLAGNISENNFTCFSPDSKRIITIYGNTAKIWSIPGGAFLSGLKGHLLGINNACFSPDGKKVVTASADNTAKIWDAGTGKLLADLAGHTKYVSSARFSPDGKEIVTASGDGTAKIWDAEKGTQLITLPGNNGALDFAQFSPDGKKIVTTTQNQSTAELWDAGTDKLLIDMKMQPDLDLMNSGGAGFASLSAQFSFDSKKVIISGLGYGEKIWSTEKRSLLFEKRVQATRVSDALFYPDGKKILTIASDNTCKIWDAETGAFLFNLKGHKENIISADFSTDGKRIVTASSDNTAKIWDANNGRLLNNLVANRYLAYAKFSPDGKKIVASYQYYNGGAQIWDAETGTKSFDLEGANCSGSAPFSPDGRKIVTYLFDSFRICDAQNGSHLVESKHVGGEINDAFFFPDGKKIVTIEDSYYYVEDSTVKKTSGDKLHFIFKHVDSAVKVWNSETGLLLFNLDDKNERVIRNIKFSPDGKKIVTVSDNLRAKIWDAETGKLIVNLEDNNVNLEDNDFYFHYDNVDVGYYYVVNSVEFSSDGKRLVTTSNDKTAKIWDTETGKLLFDLKGHNGRLYNAQFSPDDKKIITSSEDRTCKVWNAQTGKLLYTFFAIDSTNYLVTDAYDRYDGSEGARKLLYFTCGTEVISLDQVKDQLWVPNLAERINKGDSINAKKLSDLNICGLTPEIEKEATAGYHFKITPRGGGLGETVLAVNGIEVQRYKPDQLIQTDTGYTLNVPEQELKPYFIAGKQNPVTVKAYTAKNDIPSRMANAMEDETDKKEGIPNLYAVMIGISDYKSPELQLQYAAKDAQDISKAVEASARKLLNNDGQEHVFMYNLTTSQNHYQLPEKLAIKNVFDEIGKKANAKDILLIFFAGHGITSGEQKQFYLLTADASQASATGAPEEVGISISELSEWMKPENIKAQKRILILDACNSGQAINEIIKIGNAGQNYVAARNDDKSEQIKAIDKLNETSGFFILAASASNQSAYEMERYSQGLLTYSLLKAIKQQPDILEDGKYLDVSRWFGAAKNTVSDIVRQTGNRQEPQIVSAGNFDIGVVDQEVMAGIKLADEKPLFTASNLQNNDPDIAADDLHLNSLLDMQLNEIAARGDENAITYIPGSASPDAYSLGGRYEVKGDDITLKVNIRQYDTTQYKFELTGKKNDLKAIAEQVVKQATDWIVKHK